LRPGSIGTDRMTNDQTKPILILGAGIAGLAMALFLRRDGHDVAILERESQFSATGAGIQLSPNAARLLEDLGLIAEIQDVARIPEALDIARFDGKRLLRLSLRQVSQRHGAPYLTLRRADLHSVLLGAVRPDSRIQLLEDRRFTGFTRSGESVAAECSDGLGRSSMHEGRFLIGADGLWSTLRRNISTQEPWFTFHEAWRAVLPPGLVPAAFAAEEIYLRLGDHCHLVAYPVGAGELNIVLVRAAAAPRAFTGATGWSHPGDPDDLAPVLRRASPDLRQLIEAVRSWQVWSLFDMAPARMAEGQIALIGDAAHPIPPFLAQGAALAIEDAAILAKALSRSDQRQRRADLERFAQQRQARARKLRAAARSNGRIFHLADPWSLARDYALAALGPKGMLDRYDWLYGWRA